jgi:hypothetical protein
MCARAASHSAFVAYPGMVVVATPALPTSTMRRTHIVDSPEFRLWPPALTGTPSANTNDLAAIPEPSKGYFPCSKLTPCPCGSGAG